MSTHDTSAGEPVPTEPVLLQNAIFVPEVDVYVVSAHRHDYVTYRFPDGREISVDGGSGPDGYCRRVGDFSLMEEGLYVECCLNTDSPFEEIADKLLWGTRGKEGDQLLERRPIKELAARPDGVAHMRAILANCPNIGPWHKRVVEFWIVRQMEGTV